VKTSNGLHLDDDQLVWALVDEAELPFLLREHLSTCPICRANREQTAENLARVGQMAARFAPSPTKPMALPVKEPRTIAKWSWGWRAYVSAALAAALVLAVLWRAPVFRNPSGENGYTTAMDMQEAEQFMTEIAMLVDNALPAVYLDISAESSTDLDDEFMEFVVPSVENESLTYNSRKRGVSLC
jgi:predicted anti-sigma-YlaC factor YlaD